MPGICEYLNQLCASKLPIFTTRVVYLHSESPPSSSFVKYRLGLLMEHISTQNKRSTARHAREQRTIFVRRWSSWVADGHLINWGHSRESTFRDLAQSLVVVTSVGLFLTSSRHIRCCCPCKTPDSVFIKWQCYMWHLQQMISSWTDSASGLLFAVLSSFYPFSTTSSSSFPLSSLHPTLSTSTHRSLPRRRPPHRLPPHTPLSLSTQTSMLNCHPTFPPPLLILLLLHLLLPPPLLIFPSYSSFSSSFILRTHLPLSRHLLHLLLLLLILLFIFSS